MRRIEMKEVENFFFDRYIMICMVIIWVVNVFYLLFYYTIISFFVVFFSAIGFRVYCNEYLKRKKEGVKKWHLAKFC